MDMNRLSYLWTKSLTILIDNENEIIDYGNDDCWRHVRLHSAGE